MSPQCCAAGRDEWAVQPGRLPQGLFMGGERVGQHLQGPRGPLASAAIRGTGLSPDHPNLRAGRTGPLCPASQLSLRRQGSLDWTACLLPAPRPWHTSQINTAKPRPASGSFSTPHIRRYFPELRHLRALPALNRPWSLASGLGGVGRWKDKQDAPVTGCSTSD